MQAGIGNWLSGTIKICYNGSVPLIALAVRLPGRSTPLGLIERLALFYIVVGCLEIMVYLTCIPLELSQFMI